MGRYLVTGCAGFIASKVSELLLGAGHEVVGIDNLNEAYDPRLKMWRLKQLEGRSCFRFHHVDIDEFGTLERLFDEDAGTNSQAPYSAVINLAARAGVRPSVRDPWVYERTNTAGTLNLLELCRQHEIKKFVLASTSSLYGAHNPVPFSEDADTNRPLSPYAASKKGAEAMAYTYHHLHGLDVTVFRYFTVYGPAGRPDMSVFRFVRWISEGDTITVFGDGTQQRDFTFVDDIARGTIAGLKPLGYEVINLGGDRPVALHEIIAQIGQLTGRDPVIDYRASHPADVPATWANVNKAQQLLGWKSEVSVEEGLRRCVEWYEANHSLATSLELGER